MQLDYGGVHSERKHNETCLRIMSNQFAMQINGNCIRLYGGGSCYRHWQFTALMLPMKISKSIRVTGPAQQFSCTEEHSCIMLIHCLSIMLERWAHPRSHRVGPEESRSESFFITICVSLAEMGSSGSGAEPALRSRWCAHMEPEPEKNYTPILAARAGAGYKRFEQSRSGAGADRWEPAPSRLRIYLVLFMCGSCSVCVMRYK